MNKKILNLLKVIISITLIFFIIKKIGIQELTQTIMTVNIPMFLIAFTLSFFGLLLQVSRLKILVKSQNIKIRFFKLLEFSLISNFFGTFLPTAVGGDIVKMSFLGKYSKKLTVSSGIIVMDRIVGTYALVFVAFVASLIGKSILNHEVLIYVQEMFMFFGLVLILLNLKSLWKRIWSNKIIKKIKYLNTIKKFIDTIQSYSLTDKSFLKGFTISLVFYVLITLSNYFVAKSLGVDIKLLIFFVFVPLLSLASMLPLSIGGLGVRETVSVAFFSTMNIEPRFAVLISFLPFLIRSIISLVGGLIYIKNEIIINK